MSRFCRSGPVRAGKPPRAMHGLTILQLMFVLGSLGIVAWLLLTYLQR